MLCHPLNISVFLHRHYPVTCSHFKLLCQTRVLFSLKSCLCWETSAQHVCLHRAGFMFFMELSSRPGEGTAVETHLTPSAQPEHWNLANVISLLMCGSTAVKLATPMINGTLISLEFSQWSCCEIAKLHNYLNTACYELKYRCMHVRTQALTADHSFHYNLVTSVYILSFMIRSTVITLRESLSCWQHNCCPVFFVFVFWQ